MGLVADGAAMREDDEMRRGSFGARGSGSDPGLRIPIFYLSLDNKNMNSKSFLGRFHVYFVLT